MLKTLDAIGEIKFHFFVYYSDKIHSYKEFAKCFNWKYILEFWFLETLFLETLDASGEISVLSTNCFLAENQELCPVFGTFWFWFGGMSTKTWC